MLADGGIAPLTSSTESSGDRADGSDVPAFVTQRENAMTDPESSNAWKTFTEEIEVTGSQLIAQITRLIAEGNVRTIKVRSQNGDVHFEIPLTAGMVTGGIVALAAPWLVVLGALAGMVARLKLEIVRQEPAEPPGSPGAEAKEPPQAGESENAGPM